MLGNRYAPLSSDTVDCGVINDAPDSVTVTPGTTPPDESVTRPKISPLACARAIPGTNNTASAAVMNERTSECMNPPRARAAWRVPKGVVRGRHGNGAGN